MLTIFWEIKKIPLANQKKVKIILQKAFSKVTVFALAHKLAKAEDISRQVNLILADQEKIQQINREYRQRNKTTDVLSFAEIDNKQKSPHLRDPKLLGEIYLNYDWLAKDNFRDLEKLFFHGYLHLIGFDHEKDNGEMEEWEAKVLSSPVENFAV